MTEKRKIAFATVFSILCWCVMMVHAKHVETSGRFKRAPDAPTCDSLNGFLYALNITSSDRTKGPVCGGQCCDSRAEELLRRQGQKDFADLLRHNSRTLQGLLSFTATTIQNHVSELSSQSENQTLLLFSQIYQVMAVLSREPINGLYRDIRSYLLVNTTSKADFAAPPMDLKTSVNNFFTDLFPLVYHHILLSNKPNRDFTPEFKTCLKKYYENISPFTEIPRQIADSLSRSLEATRLLLQAFRIGTEVLATTDALLIDETGKGNAECHEALLRMTYCPRCLGLSKHTKPCSGYCLNVLRGCLTKYVAELDSPWNGYVDGVETLVNALKRNNAEGLSATPVIRSLDARISDAIMKAMEQGNVIDPKVKRSCGQATYSTREEPVAVPTSTAIPAASKLRSASPRVFAALPETQLSHFQASIAKSRSFYGNLADTLCQDDSFAEQKDKSCWNGERIAEYTKTVVDVGLVMQKYNPEVKPLTNLQSGDPRIAELVDKLRHVHHMAMSSIGSGGADVDYMQRDGADGSGSGGGPDFEDPEEEYGMRGSGSGHGPIVTDGDGVMSRFNPEFEPAQKHPKHSVVTAPPAGGAAKGAASLGVAATLVASLLLLL